MHVSTRTLFFALLFVLFAADAAQGGPAPVYRNPQAPLEARVDDLFSRMTPAERHGLLTGTYFTTQGIPRLGVPPMSFVDGSLGIRGGEPSTQGTATLFPGGVILAATWDPSTAAEVGSAIGEEAISKGTRAQVVLGPDVNILRSPLNGRDGESFSEDPYITGQIAAGWITGLQSTGVSACIKHFACNNEEVDRDTVDVHVDERALREIYLPGFEAGVEQGHAWALMTSYNLLRGRHTSENEYLVRNILKDEWKFDGMVTSDWGGVHSTAGAVIAGNDLEMPGPGYLSRDRLEAALRAGAITEAQIDDADKRILRTIIRTGLLDPRPDGAEDGAADEKGYGLLPLRGEGARVAGREDPAGVDSTAHRSIALKAAEDGMVLLKNDGGALPLDPKAIHSIALIGPYAQYWQMGGGGSAYVTPHRAVEPLDGIENRVQGLGIRVDCVDAEGGEQDLGEPVPSTVLHLDGSLQPGLLGDYYANTSLSDTAEMTRIDPAVDFDWGVWGPGGDVPATNFSARWRGVLTAPETGRYTLILSADDGCRLILDGKKLIEQWGPSDGSPLEASIDLTAGEAHEIEIDYLQLGGVASCKFDWLTPDSPSPFPDAVQAASQADAAIMVVGTGGEGEGWDRSSMRLPGDQAALIRAVAAANKRTIVVVNNGGPVQMSDWVDAPAAIIDAFFPGEEGGDALAAILFGDVNPSGKLPYTIGARREDYPDFGNFPGTKGNVNYSEGIYVGYRHFDKAGIAPTYPFGYGLSYTTFDYSAITLSSQSCAPDGSVNATVTMTNTGRRAGAEVAELYIHDPTPHVDKPVRELKGFQKVRLEPGETKSVTFTITPRMFAYCDPADREWRADAGQYGIEVGASSRDIRASAPVRLTADYTQPIPHMDIDPETGLADLARWRPVTASSTESAAYPPEDAVDGDGATRWSSAFSDPQWISVDLGRPARVAGVQLTWEAAHAKSFSVQTSFDGSTWTDAVHTDRGSGGTETFWFTPVSARYVRVYGTKRATAYGYSLYSFKVFGPREDPSPALTRRPLPKRKVKRNIPMRELLWPVTTVGGRTMRRTQI